MISNACKVHRRSELVSQYGIAKAIQGSPNGGLDLVKVTSDLRVTLGLFHPTLSHGLIGLEGLVVSFSGVLDVEVNQALSLGLGKVHALKDARDFLVGVLG
jgi:hypothetical protein